MEKPFILHMLTPGTNVSPFDVNMALDAGFNAVIPYTGVTLEEVTALVQDAIFSRGPKGVKHTGGFHRRARHRTRRRYAKAHEAIHGAAI